MAITLAKQVATLDRISGGRVILGVGTGWNTVELANHGVRWADRWKVARERILAMREIWTKETPEFRQEVRERQGRIPDRVGREHEERARGKQPA